MTEAYVKEHKMEKTLEAMINSLKAQPANPYLAMVRRAAALMRPTLTPRGCHPRATALDAPRSLARRCAVPSSAAASPGARR